MLTCASLYQLPPESGLVEKVERELFGEEEEEVGWKEGEPAGPSRRLHGAAAFPGWVLDTKPLKKLWVRGHKDRQAAKLQREAMPDSLQVFHPVQVFVGRRWMNVVADEESVVDVFNQTHNRSGTRRSMQASTWTSATSSRGACVASRRSLPTRAGQARVSGTCELFTQIHTDSRPSRSQARRSCT